MNFDDGIERFLSAQENVYDKALREIKNGMKESHWMWFVFPQIRDWDSRSIMCISG